MASKERIAGIKSRTKVWPCDNCGRAHWGYYHPETPEEYGGRYWTGWQWTTPQGIDREGLACEARP